VDRREWDVSVLEAAAVAGTSGDCCRSQAGVRSTMTGVEEDSQLDAGHTNTILQVRYTVCCLRNL